MGEFRRVSRVFVAVNIWEGIVIENHLDEVQAIRIGDMLYHTENERLIGSNGDGILLRSQSAQVLSILAKNLGKVVRRDDLFTQVWADVAVTDDSLTQCIADIRRAIGDRDRKVLRTLPKRGYVLTGMPDENPTRGPASAKPAITDTDSNSTSGSSDTTRAELDPRDILPTVAVLPMRAHMSGNKDPWRMFVSSEIVRSLSRSHDLNVISGLSTAHFWDSADGLSNLRQTLNADFCVSGHAWTEGNTAIISFEFAESDNQRVLCFDRIEMPLSSVLDGGEWVETIQAHIRRALMTNEIARVLSRPIESLKLYSVLHGAVGLMHQLSPEDFNKSRDMLLSLVEKSPRSPAPLAWLSRWHVLRAMQGWSDNPQADADHAIAFAERALDRDPENTLALTSLGFVMTNLAHRFDEAKSYYDSAIELNPNDAQARGLRGMLQAFCDSAAEGKRDAERALHLTPKDPHRFFYLVLAAGANLSAGDYRRAVTLAEASRKLKRTHVSTLRTLAAAHEGAGNHIAAQKTVHELMKLQPDLRVGSWLRASPARSYENGKRFAQLLRGAGVPA